MDEISTWFENEFGYLGFSVTPTIYDPENFTPVRGVLFGNPRVNGGYTFKTKIRISIEMVSDIQSTYQHYNIGTEYKELLTEMVESFLNEYGMSISSIKDFKPIKKINKLKL